MALRTIQIGLGDWGRNWAATIVPQVPEVETVGYVARDPARTRTACEQAGLAPRPFFASISEAIRQTGAEAVMVLTTTEAHSELVAEALEVGAHVLVEKPFIADLSVGKKLVARAASRNRLLMVSQNFRFFPAVKRAAQIVREESLGPLASIGIDFRRAFRSISAERSAWLASVPHLLLMDLGIHHFDLMRMIIGREPTSVYCRAWHHANSPFRDPVNAAAIVTFEGGIVVNWQGSWEAGGRDTPFSGEWRMDCRLAEVQWTCRGDRDVSLDSDRVSVIAAGQSRDEPLPKDRLFGRAAVLQAFVKAIMEGSRPWFFPDGKDNLKSIALMRAAVQSSETGQIVSVAEVAPE